MPAHSCATWRTRSAAMLSLIAIVSMLLSTFPAPEPVEAAEVLPTSLVGNGTYFVYATREGLVGGTTSSGHRIVANDFFVALPACLPQNCPRGASRGNMTKCGNRCYVRVLNPVTNQCRVEPVKDLGPWFTVDDWWNPTESRHLNSLATNPHDLPQGYTGSDAARDGLNVGYGISAGGIGHDNTGTLVNRPNRAVGNRAAIDLADGTWRNLRLTSPDTIGSRVFVTMLWQSGGDPATEAQRCGHQLNQRGGTLYTLPTQPSHDYSYPPPASTVEVTPAPESTAVVVGTGGVGLRCRTGPSTGASVITTLPEGEKVSVRGLPISGWQPIVCAGKDGWASNSYLRVTYATPTPAPTLEPTSTMVATTPEATPGTASTEEPGTVIPASPTTTEAPATPDSTPGTPGHVATPTPETPTSSTETPLSTVEPSPTVSPPAPTGRAVVTGTGGVGLRCRTAPSTAGAKIATLAESATVTLRGKAQAGWYPVVCSGQDGWASASYLRVTVSPELPVTPSPTVTSTPVTPTITPTPVTPTATSLPITPVPTTPIAGSALVTGTGGVGLRCRNAPSTAGGVIVTLREGTTVPVRGASQAGWTPVRCNSSDGWVSGTYVRLTTPVAVTPTATSVPTQTGVVANSGGDNVNCRTQATTNSGIITSLREGTQLQILGDNVGDWVPIRCANRDGFIHGEYVQFSNAPMSTLATSEQAAEDANETEATTSSTEQLTPIEPTTVISEPVSTESATAAPAAIEVVTTAVPVTHSGYIASDDGGSINCRTAPTTDAEVVTVLQHGAWIELRGDPSNGWQGVRCGDRDGYVAADFISLTEPAPLTTPTEPPASLPDDESSLAEQPVPQTSAPPGSNPQFGGNALGISAMWVDGGSSPWNAADGSTATEWSPPVGMAESRLTIDLGGTRELSGVRWMFGSSGSTGDLQVYTSLDGESWSWAGSAGARQPLTWEGIWASGPAHYVRLISVDTAGIRNLSSITEVQIWGSAISERSETTGHAQKLPSRVAHVRRFGGTITVSRRGSTSLD